NPDFLPFANTFRAVNPVPKYSKTIKPILMSRLKFTFLLLIIYTTVNVHAQQPGTTLAQQYQDVVEKSGSYKGFKEIRQDKLDLLWKNISDTLNKERALVNETRAKLGSNDQAVLASKTELENAKKELALSAARVDQISLLGIYVEKRTYNMIMWGLVFLLAGSMAFAFYRTNSSVKEARYRTGLYNDLSEEFQKHKINSNEKEKKLARELQTERNRIAELTAR
ncbi:MAG: hypothetical protein V4708_12720, partial [Bacteroidota bacterium]